MDEVEIIDEEKTILFSNEHSTTTLRFMPGTKEFRSALELKGDAYYRNELYEYKLSANPIEVFIRLIERSDEPPPDQYVVKDGVVLESEILKEGRSGYFEVDLLKTLKEAVEWHKLELCGGHAVLLYILSLHSEILSKNDYRKFLRQTEQRLKFGLSKVGKKLKEREVATGLQLSDGKFGKQISYPDGKKPSDKDLEEYWSFYALLFDEKSPEYPGISKNEFESGPDILRHIDNLLNKKETSLPEQDPGKGGKSLWRWLSYGWAVVANLITLGVVLLVYGKINEGFETVAVSILILIYLSLQGFKMAYGQTVTTTAFGLYSSFGQVRKLLKDEPGKDEKEEVWAAKKKVGVATVKMYINAAFLVIIYLIALFHLIGTTGN